MKNERPSFNWKEYSLKGIAWILIGVAVMLLLFFIVVCLIYFPPRGMSSSLSSLGLYGDYFGGIVGGITSVATLGVTIYLAMSLHRLEKENTESATEGQRKIAIMQIKLKEFAIFNEQCDGEIKALTSSDLEHEIDDSVYRSILSAAGRITTLFPELENREKYIELRLFINYLRKMSECSQEVNLKMSQHQPPEEIDTIIGNMNDYFEAAIKEHHKLMKKLSDWALE